VRGIQGRLIGFESPMSLKICGVATQDSDDENMKLFIYPVLKVHASMSSQRILFSDKSYGREIMNLGTSLRRMVRFPINGKAWKNDSPFHGDG